jgi:hypothetical protein
MNVDKIEGFAALEHYGIRVARSRYVDSAEDAVAFAERRNAPDPRFVPIVLRCLHAGRQHIGKETPLETVEAVPKAYDRISRSSLPGDRILAQVLVAPGTDIIIVGGTDRASGRTIELRSATHSVKHTVPLGSDGARELASNYEGHGHHGSRESAVRMLEHLLLRVAEFLETSGVRNLRLDIRLHENSYTVLDASMTSARPLQIPQRLDPRAHDRKGDEYHPAGRQ